MKTIVRNKILHAFLLSVLLTSSAVAGCSAGKDLNSEISRIVKPFHFSIIDWEIKALSRQFDDYIFNQIHADAENSELVKEYFSNREKLNELEQRLVRTESESEEKELAASFEILSVRNDEILPEAERIIQKQIETVLIETGIASPWQDAHEGGTVFPPVNFVIQPPPHLLVISPRDNITRYKDITLAQQLREEDKEELEQQIEALDMSALVVRLGGIATYPAFVADTMDLRYSIEVAVEEWFHQYLFFRPLGFQYGLHVAGIRQDYEVATINEALAGMVSEEIASLVWEKYYAALADARYYAAQTAAGEFDFYAEMRKIRLTVDAFLEAGEIEEAEQYMEESRKYLYSQGYYIRKLNQAYFAFYGTYAASPESISPIGKGLKVLREQNTSLKDFVKIISAMTDAGEIIAASG
ncbi:MAG: hypothetical protein PHW65_01250 [Dehalococcoidales bacterium]|nr:hypothetical protein [Dehalococcoidales bacterium]